MREQLLNSSAAIHICKFKTNIGETETITALTY